MANKTGISWTESTWNPTTGCTKVSPGCKNCYAERLSKRLQRMGVKKYSNGFKLTLHPQALEVPPHWRKPRKIFVDSMSDLLHPDIPEAYICKAFDVMEKADQHKYQVLTKRPERMAKWIDKYLNGKTLKGNIWLGTSVENSENKNRIDVIRSVPSRIRFISFEPLIDSVGSVDLSGIHWVIVGGESGKNYRPLNPEWAREIRDQCLEQQIPFYFKQVGGPKYYSGGDLLDGREWKEYPIQVMNSNKFSIKIS